MKFKDGKWSCYDCGKEMNEDEYVGLNCCSECYHERIWGKKEEE